MKHAHVGHVRQWCLSLGVLAAVSITRHEAETKLAAYVPLLVERFPDAAFCQSSLEHVAFMSRKGFPTYAELAEWLSQWWKDHRPPPLAISVEQSSETAKWREIEREVAASWDDPAGILDRVRQCQDDPLLLRLLGAAVRRWAPQHLGYLPPHILAALDQPDEVRLDRDERPAARPSHLTPEQIELAGGRKRTDAQLDAAADTPPALALDPDAAARLAPRIDDGAYPARDDHAEA